MLSYYLLDLERTISNEKPYYWKGNKYGYTCNIAFAGLFSEVQAKEIQAKDIHNTTILVPESLVFKILGKDMKIHEGINN